MNTAVTLVSLVVNMLYMLSMVYLFWLFFTAQNKAQLQTVIKMAKLPVILAVISMICYILRADLVFALLGLLKVVGPMAIAWSATVRIKYLPKTAEEKLIEDIERELYKF